jgi:hypothetical protein
MLVIVIAAMFNPTFSARNTTDTITNQYFSLKPGLKMVYVGREDGKPAREEIYVLPRVTVIDGVRVATVRDTVYMNGQLAERADDWYAQDASGNVWYMGENSRAYKNGRVVETAGSWEAGKNGAAPGIIMPAHPRIGDRYRQEYAPKIAEDQAQVTALNAAVKVPYGKYSATLVTREFSPLEPSAQEYKMYAKGVGLVRSYSDDGSTDLRLQFVK